MTDQGPAPFDPVAALQALARAGVAFVLVGGLAARAHGSASVTRDVDICHSRDAGNLERLADVLQSIHARLRGVDDDVPFLLDARTLAAGGNFTFKTDLGDIDILAMPAGTAGYDDLIRDAETIDFDGVQLRVATIDQMIRMKTAAARGKDLKEVEILEAIKRNRS